MKIMPKTREQNLQIKEERRKSILVSSLYLFAFKGYEAVNIDDVTKAAKCSHGLFYHYFDNKEDLFHALMHEIVEEKAMKLQQGLDLSQRSKFAVNDIITHLLEALKSKDDNLVCVLYLLFNIHMEKDNIPKPIDKDIKRKKPVKLYDALYALIQKGQEEGDFLPGNPKIYTITIMSLLNGLTYNRLCIGQKKFICPDTSIVMNILIKK